MSLTAGALIRFRWMITRRLSGTAAAFRQLLIVHRQAREQETIKGRILTSRNFVRSKIPCGLV